MNPGAPRFLDTPTVLVLQSLLIMRYGGAEGLRDPGMLESALAQPRQGFGDQFAHAFPFEMAAAYAFHLAKNHPFVDGNKRIALMAAGAFLRMNGWDLISTGVEAADAVIAAVEGRLSKAELAAWLERHCVPRTPHA